MKVKIGLNWAKTGQHVPKETKMGQTKGLKAPKMIKIGHNTFPPY